MIQVKYWSQGKKQLHSLGYMWDGWEGYKSNQGSLRVPHVVKLSLPGDIKYILQHGRNVFCCHLLKAFGEKERRYKWKMYPKCEKYNQRKKNLISTWDFNSRPSVLVLYLRNSWFKGKQRWTVGFDGRPASPTSIVESGISRDS